VLVTVRDGPTDQLFPALSTGEIDIVVGRLPERDLPLARMYAFQHEVLYREALCAVTGCKHPLAPRHDIELRDLLDWPWIFPLQASPARLTAEHLFLDAGLSLPVNVVESLSLLTNIGLMQKNAIDLIDATRGGRTFFRTRSAVDPEAGRSRRFR